MKIKINIGFMNDYIEERINSLRKEFSIDIVYDDYAGLDDVDVLLATSLSEGDLETQDKLKAIFVPFTGLNKFPLMKIEEEGIYISNTHAKAHIVAERGLALTLALMGKVIPYDQELRNNDRWLTREFWGSEFWNSLYNKKCGIVGMGSIGRNTKKLLKPFNCKIINLKRDEKKGMADIYSEDINGLLDESDVIFLTCALNEETKHLINKSNIHLLKNKFIINVSRGNVIEEEALYAALEEKIILGAAIDVWYQYPKNSKTMKPSKYDLSKFNNIVMSPHASCHAEEAKHTYYEDIFNQIENYITDKLK